MEYMRKQYNGMLSFCLLILDEIKKYRRKFSSIDIYKATLSVYLHLKKLILNYSCTSHAVIFFP